MLENVSKLLDFSGKKLNYTSIRTSFGKQTMLFSICSKLPSKEDVVSISKSTDELYDVDDFDSSDFNTSKLGSEALTQPWIKQENKR